MIGDLMPVNHVQIWRDAAVFLGPAIATAGIAWILFGWIFDAFETWRKQWKR